MFRIVWIVLGISTLAGAETLRVGIHSESINPPVGTPLAGHGSEPRRLSPWDWFNKYPYVFFLKPSTGVMDEVRTKAMVLEVRGGSLIFLSLDLVAVTSKFRIELINRLEKAGLKIDALFVSATHTHNGPGAVSDNFFWQVAAVDRFHKDIYEKVLSSATRATLLASAKRQPAQLHHARFEAKGLQRNRRKMKGHFDPMANLILAKNLRDQWLGGIVHFAIHGIALKPEELKLSADVPGRIEVALESKLSELNHHKGQSPGILFINGAEGDVVPVGHGEAAMDRIGSEFSEQALLSLSTTRKLLPKWSLYRKEVNLGRPGVQIGECIDGEIDPAAGMFSEFFVKKSWWRKLRFGLKWFFPEQTELLALTLDDLLLLSWPGEPTTTLGLLAKEMGKRLGFKETLSLGLTNEHLAYFTSPEEYEAGGYEACASFYGPRGGLRILESYEKALFPMSKRTIRNLDNY